MRFQREPISALWPEMAPLLEQHAAEISFYPDIPLDVDRHLYEVCEEQDQLRVYTARVDGVLVGYAAFYVRWHPHYKTSKQAMQDVLFLLPEHRRKGLGAEFIAWCDEQLRAQGCQVVHQHVKARSDLNFGPLLERMGYQAMDMIYSRRLD